MTRERSRTGSPPEGEGSSPLTPPMPEFLSGGPLDLQAGLLFFATVWAIVFMAYLRTLAPGLVFGDGPELAAAAYVLGIPHPTGYPLYMLLLRFLMFLPLGEPIVCAHLFSALCGAATAGLTALVAHDLLASLYPRWPRNALMIAGAAAALLFAFVRLMWQNAVVAEVYALHMVFAVGCVRALQLFERQPAPRPFLWAWLCFGLGMAHHRLSSAFLLPLLVATVVAWRRWAKPKTLATLAAAMGIVLLCLLLYLYLPLRAAQRPPINWNAPSTWEGFWRHVTGTEYLKYRLMRLSPGAPFVLSWWLTHELLILRQFVGDVAAQTLPVRLQELLNLEGRIYFQPTFSAGLAGTLILLLAAVGVRQWWRAAPLTALAALLIAAHNFSALLLYNIPDISDYTLFVLWVIYLAMLLGIIRIIVSWIYPLIAESVRPDPRFAYALLVLPAFVFAVNFSDCDESQHDDAEQFSYFIFSQKTSDLPEGSILLTSADYDTFTAWYRQICRGERRDVLIFGANFISSPWYEQFFSPDQVTRHQLRFYSGPPRSAQEFARRLDEGILSANVGRYPVFTTIDDPAVVNALSERYHFEHIRQGFFRPRDVLGLKTAHLWRIRPKGGGDNKP